MATIVLIDDDAPTRDVLTQMLSRAGYRVLPAEDGEVGLALVEREAVDLVITDIIMPNREGIETIVALRKLNPGLPVIAISGRAHGAVGSFLSAAERLGATATLSKPVERVQLLEAVERALAGA